MPMPMSMPMPMPMSVCWLYLHEELCVSQSTGLHASTLDYSILCKLCRKPWAAPAARSDVPFH